MLQTNSKRVCATRVENAEYKLLFIYVYMPYESDDHSTVDFADQLFCIENVFNTNSDCHIIIGGDFNVDFSRDWTHNVLLNNFCATTGLQPIICHKAYNIDYT